MQPLRPTAQVVVDVPRTAPEVAFFHQAPVQKSLERILYIWGVRC
jgi:TBC1 domain family member 2